MPTYDTLKAYYEYCVDCVYEGIEPLPYWKWLYEEIR